MDDDGGLAQQLQPTEGDEFRITGTRAYQTHRAGLRLDRSDEPGAEAWRCRRSLPPGQIDDEIDESRIAADWLIDDDGSSVASRQSCPIQRVRNIARSV